MEEILNKIRANEREIYANVHSEQAIPTETPTQIHPVQADWCWPFSQALHHLYCWSNASRKLTRHIPNWYASRCRLACTMLPRSQNTIFGIFSQSSHPNIPEYPHCLSFLFQPASAQMYPVNPYRIKLDAVWSIFTNGFNMSDYYICNWIWVCTMYAF